MKDRIAQEIQNFLLQKFPVLVGTPIHIQFQTPKNKENGDLSSNIAMQVAKKVNQSPLELANDMKSALEKIEAIEKIEVAQPGFLNFYLVKKEIFKKLNEMIIADKAYGQHKPNDHSVNIEFVSANPTGDLHIGHARGAAYGDVLSRLLKKAGYDVTKEFYINDAGMQIEKLGHSVHARYLQLQGIDVPMPEDGYHAEDILSIAQQLLDHHKTEIDILSEDELIPYFSNFALKFELDKIKKDLSFFDVHFDIWSSEKHLHQEGRIENVLKTLQERGMTYHAENAVWLKSTLYGDDKDRVLIKKDGSYTYVTPDIAYHQDKIIRTEMQGKKASLIDILGGDHHGYIQRMKAALQALGHSEDILDVKIIQMVRFIQDGKEVKMSKRTGNAIKLREFLAEIGKDAARYFFAMRNSDTPLDFDMTLALEQSNNNPVYYAQYAHARINSILKKFPVEDSNYIPENLVYDLLNQEAEREIANKLNQYEELILLAAKRREPFKITNYIQSLATDFHSYYNAYKIIDEQNIDLSWQRRGLIMAVRAVLRSAFDIIGIDAPEQM